MPPLRTHGWIRVISAAALLVNLLGSPIGSASAAGVDAPAADVVDAASPTEALAVAAAPIAAKLSCAGLVENGTTTPTDPLQPAEPDFSQIPGFPARITSAKIVAATGQAPEYCDVLGYIQGQIHFELKLPTTTWQGRYLQQGCGGFCGAINPTTFPACDQQLGGDFALSATDDGHTSGNAFDGLWAGDDEQLRIDFDFRAVHGLAVVSKAIIAAFYGQAPSHAYFNGCSDGGREGLMEAQRFPDDFDGIIAGAPANFWAFLPTEATAWVVRANLDPNGNLIIDAPHAAVLHNAVLAACDDLDGLHDNQIDDPRACQFDPASIECPGGGSGPSCLSAAQVQAARTIYSFPHTPSGEKLYPGVGEELGSELGWTGPIPWISPPPGAPMLAFSAADNYLRYMALPLRQGGLSVDQFQFTRQDFERIQPEGLKGTSIDPDLSRFKARGGKLILYHGWADPLIPPRGTVDYYAALERAIGGPERTREFARLFMFPAMFHCGGGGPAPNTSDFILDLVNWVEQGQAPDKVIGTQTDPSGNVVRTRPVFVYPIRAQYTGSGDINDAANFVPVAPAKRPDDDIHWLGSDLMRHLEPDDQAEP
jgi:Tannase and feruloyl esterase